MFGYYRYNINLKHIYLQNCQKIVCVCICVRVGVCVCRWELRVRVNVSKDDKILLSRDTLLTGEMEKIPQFISYKVHIFHIATSLKLGHVLQVTVYFNVSLSSC